MTGDWSPALLASVARDHGDHGAARRLYMTESWIMAHGVDGLLAGACWASTDLECSK